MNIQKKRIIYIAVSLLTLLFIIVKREALCSVISVLIYASAITLLLTPLCNRLENRGIRTSWSSVLSILIMLLLLFIVLSIFIPYLLSHTMSFLKRSIPIISDMVVYTVNFCKALGINSWDQSRVIEQFGTALSKMTSSATHIGVAFATQTGKIGFSLVLSYYFLRERNTLSRHLLLFVPIHLRKTCLSIITGCKNVLLSYLSGLMKTSLFISAATYAVLLIIGIPDAFLLSIFMGLLEVLPYIGPVAALIPIIISSIPLGWGSTMLAFVLIIVIQQIEGNIISPYFTASSTSIHPLTALISVFIFGSIFGLWGILFAIPVIVMIRSACWSIRKETFA